MKHNEIITVYINWNQKEQISLEYEYNKPLNLQGDMNIINMLEDNDSYIDELNYFYYQNDNCPEWIDIQFSLV